MGHSAALLRATRHAIAATIDVRFVGISDPVAAAFALAEAIFAVSTLAVAVPDARLVHPARGAIAAAIDITFRTVLNAVFAEGFGANRLVTHAALAIRATRTPCAIRAAAAHATAAVDFRFLPVFYTVAAAGGATHSKLADQGRAISGELARLSEFTALAIAAAINPGFFTVLYAIGTGWSFADTRRIVTDLARAVAAEPATLSRGAQRALITAAVDVCFVAVGDGITAAHGVRSVALRAVGDRTPCGRVGVGRIERGVRWAVFDSVIVFDGERAAGYGEQKWKNQAAL